MFLNISHLKSFFICIIIVLTQISPCSFPQLPSKKREKSFDQCCAFPCQHGGICIDRKFGYMCDCQNTGYYGKNCAIETWMAFLMNLFNSFIETAISIHYVFSSFFGGNSLYFPSYYKLVGDSLRQVHTVGIYGLDGEPYVTLNPLYNNYGAVRLTTSVPEYCPTPLGIKGKKYLNPVSEVYNNLLQRQTFQASKSVNLFFTIYGLHFFLQFLSHGNLHGVTCSHIYAEHGRSFSKGKLLTEMFRGEEYPICQQTIYKKTFTYYLEKSEQEDWKFSILKQNSLTYAIATLWVREHNRVCDILSKIWPSWDDERLFETARNIVTGEVLAITLSEWYPVFMGYKKTLFYDPSFSQLEYTFIHNRLPIETFLAFHWANLIPDSFVVNNYTVHLTELYWDKLEVNLVKKFGLYNIVKAFTVTPAGQGSIINAAKSLSEITKYIIEIGRKLRIPSFNRMRITLGLKPYNKFSDIVKTEKWDPIFKKIYGNVEGLEFLPGILIESSLEQKNPLGETATTLIGPWLFKALLTHPLGSKSMWKPSTMGGKVGWDIVNNAKLKNLICQNVIQPEKCKKKNLFSFKLKSEKQKRGTLKRIEKQRKFKSLK